MNSEAREQLILENIPLVKRIAKARAKTLPPWADIDDLIQAGMLGLIDAANRFDPQKCHFPGYARHRIIGAIQDSLRQIDHATRDQRRRINQIERTHADLDSRLHREASAAEVASALGVQLSELHKKFLPVIVSLSGRPAYEKSRYQTLDPYQVPADPSSRPDRMCVKSEITQLLANASRRLPPRYRQALRLYYYEDIPMKEVGRMMGVNESRISQMLSRAVELMRPFLTEQGLAAAA